MSCQMRIAWIKLSSHFKKILSFFPTELFTRNSKKASERRRDDACNFTTLRLPPPNVSIFNVKAVNFFITRFYSNIYLFTVHTSLLNWMRGGEGGERLEKGYTMLFAHTNLPTHVRFSTKNFPDANVDAKKKEN